MNINDIAITSLEVITAVDIQTGDYLFTMDELHNATIAQTQEKTDIVGKQGRKLTSMKRNKAVTVSGTNGMLSLGLLGMQTGTHFVDGTAEILWNEFKTVNSNTTTIDFVAVGTEGNEIQAVYIKNADGTRGASLEQAAEAGEGKFTYAPANKTLTFTGLADGTEVVIYYKRKVAGASHINESDVYSGKCALYIDALGEDKCSNVYRVQIYIPKADFSGEFSFEMGDNQTVHAFEAESLAGACGLGGALWNFVVFGANAADAT